MTAKRFKEEMGIAKFIDNQTGKEYSEYNLDEIVELLNELNEEAKDNEHYHTVVLELYKAVSKENEHIKQTIQDMIKTERTELGQSVLRQLGEAIQ